MPRQKDVDQGRGFNLYENIMWTQRVEKEERALLGEDRIEKHDRRERHKQNADIKRLEAKVLGRETAAMKDSYTSAMYRSNGLPAEYRALNRWPVRDAVLITCHPKKRDEEGLTPKLRFHSAYMPAMWVPGTGKILQHRPEFYLDDTHTSKKNEPPADAWRLPAAGARKPEPGATPALTTAIEPAQASQACRGSSPGSYVGRSASRTSFMPGSCISVQRSEVGSTVNRARVSASAEHQFQVGPGSVQVFPIARPQDRSLPRRSRSSTLVAAGDAVLPNRERGRLPRPATPAKRASQSQENCRSLM